MTTNPNRRAASLALALLMMAGVASPLVTGETVSMGLEPRLAAEAAPTLLPSGFTPRANLGIDEALPETLPAAPEGLADADALASPALLPAAGFSLEENLGQWHPDAHYRVHAAGYEAFLAAGKLVLVFPEQDRGVAVAMEFVGADLQAPASPEGALEQRSHYLRGNDPAQWVTDVPHHSSVRYAGLYPGIDLLYHGAPDGVLEYDFHVSPGASPQAILLRFDGADRVRVDEAGDLLVEAAGLSFRQAAPVAYQEALDGRVDVPSSFAVLPDGSVAIRVPSYDASRPLVIDPLVYSTFIGGSSLDRARAIAIDSSGSAYITGDTSSLNYPTTVGSYRPTPGLSTDVFVTKFNAAGTGLAYSTYLAGSDWEDSWAITVDPSGNAYVVGKTNSFDYPKTVGAYRTSGNGWFLTKLNPSGSALSYSTLLPGATWYHDVAVSSGQATIVGEAGCGYPVTADAYQSFHVGTCTIADAVVTKINSAGSALVYSSYIGGSAFDAALAVAVESGYMYVAGTTQSTDFPTSVAAYQSTKSGGEDVFVAKLSSAGADYSTYVGGSGNDEALALAVKSGEAYLTGWTASSNYPTTSGAYDTSLSGTNDAFVTAVSFYGTSLLFSTYLGGSGAEIGMGLGLDSTGRVTLAGRTSSSNFPTLFPMQASRAGGEEGFVTQFHYMGTGGLRHSTYIGGSSNDYVEEAAVDASGNAFLTGTTSSSNYPTTAGAYSTAWQDNFVSKVSPPSAPNAPSGLTPSCGVPRGVKLSWTAPATNGAPILEYDVYRWNSLLGGYESIGWTTALSYTDVPPFQPSQIYAVEAVNAFGASPRSVTGYDPCDTEPPTVSGAPVVYPWATTVPEISGVTWQDTYSGLAASVTYTIGTCSGCSNVKASTAVPTQPAAGSTDPYTPSWTPPTIAQGTNYVNVVVKDTMGSTRTSNGAYVVRYDTAGPTIPSLSTSPSMSASQFYSLTGFTVLWTGSDPHSGVDGYNWVLSTDPNAAVATTKTAEESATSASYSSWAFGTRYFRIRGVDNLGNWGPIATFQVNLDTVAPAFTLQSPSPGATGVSLLAEVRANFNDADGGLDPAQVTPVDASTVVFEIDGVDILTQWRPNCAPAVALAPCRVEVDANHVLYKPSVPWTPGVHTVFVEVGDTAVPSNRAGVTWTFTV